MSKPLDLEGTVASGGGEKKQSSKVDVDDGALQYENKGSGASSDMAFHLEVRVKDSLDWVDWVKPFKKVKNGEGGCVPVDLGNIQEVRGRIVNNGSNNGKGALVLQTL